MKYLLLLLLIPHLACATCVLNVDIDQLDDMITKNSVDPDKFACTTKRCVCADGKDLTKVVLAQRESSTGTTIVLVEDQAKRDSINLFVNAAQRVKLLRAAMAARTITFDQLIELLDLERKMK